MLSLRSLRIKAMQYLFAHHIQQKAQGMDAPKPLSPRAQQHIHQQLQHNVQTIHHLHNAFLQLMTTWADLEAQHAAKLTKETPTPLSQDPFLTQLRLHPTFIALCEQYPIPFSIDHITRWYYDYLDTPPPPNTTFHVRTLLQWMLQEPRIQAKAAHHSIFWQEDKPIIVHALRRFLKAFAHNPTQAFDFYHTPLTPHKKDFYQHLITKTLHAWSAHNAALQTQLQHWTLDRINLLDQILIHMTLTEIQHFPDIPPNVSINEYLEIAKHYSTPQSHAFINGLVDTTRKAQGWSTPTHTTPEP